MVLFCFFAQTGGNDTFLKHPRRTMRYTTALQWLVRTERDAPYFVRLFKNQISN